jgi:branched-chain amino acid transport system permease protein
LLLCGSFFAISTLALAVVLQTLIVNWDFVGGSRGAYVIRPENFEFAGIQVNYIEYLFALMLLLAVIALTTARVIERSQLGFGFATIRDDELAAEGVRRADTAPQADCDDVVGRFHGYGRCAVPLLHRLSSTCLGFWPRICG